VTLKRQVERGIQQRVARADEGHKRLALRRDERLLEGDPLIARQHRFADADEAVAVADGGWSVGHLVAARLPLAYRPAKLLEGFKEERFNRRYRK